MEPNPINYQVPFARNTGKVTLVVVMLITFFANNYVVYPDLMEARNIIAAREMLYDGHWLVPTLNGELRIEKPPLPTWIAACVEAVWPQNIAAQRVPAGMAAVMLVWFAQRFACRVLRQRGIVPALILCTSYSIILMGRTATWDIYCHAFMMGGIYFLARASQVDGTGRKYFVVAGLMMGLSIMSKGPVALYALLLPCVLSAALTFRPTMQGKWNGMSLMIITALVTGGWWYVYIALTTGDAAAQVATKEAGAWINHNIRPWWYYWKFFLEVGVWAPMLLTALLFPCFQKKLRRQKSYMFAIVWILTMLILLSALPEKKPRYLLPMLIPACYAMSSLTSAWASRFSRNIASLADKLLFRANCLLIAIAVLLLPVLLYIFYKQGFASLGAWAATIAISCVVTIWLVRDAARLRPMEMVCAVVVLFCALEIFVLPCLSGVINNPDMHSISATRKMASLRSLPFYHNAADDLRIEMVYETGRKIRPLDISSIDSVECKVPFVLLTHKRASEEMPREVVNAFRLVPIGHYDDNRRPKGNRRYSPDFIYYVTVVRQK